LHDLVPVQDIRRGDVGYQYFYSEALQKVWSVVEQKGEYDAPYKGEIGTNICSFSPKKLGEGMERFAW
jgi:hypothetical protein